jgi:phosphatidylserine/phosphatidylglycerophosphate/cardiolipin synthase-like enzyme
MIKKFSVLIILLLTGIAHAGWAVPFEEHASYTVCFTPPENCTKEIVGTINNSVNHIWVQAYAFTALPISEALINAQERGVKVEVILDKSNLKPSPAVRALEAQHIPIWIDARKAIAHNKVIIIDETKVITGSFNFTNAAQYRNVENLLIISDVQLAETYLRNWQERKQQSYLLKNSNEKGYPVHAPRESNHSLAWFFQQLWELMLHWLKKWF